MFRGWAKVATASAFGLFTATAGLGAVGVAPAAAAELKLTFGELAGLLQSIVGAASIYLNNAGGMFASGSYIQLTSTQQFPISVPVKSFDILGSTYGYQVSDIKSKSVKIVPIAGALRVVVTFETSGPEAVATCISGPCLLVDALPDIQWNNAVINIDFVPIKYNGSISLEVRNVTTGGTSRAVCKSSTEFIAREACSLGLPLANRSIAQVRADLPGVIKTAVNQPAVQQQLADSLKPYLSLGQVGTVSVSDVASDSKAVTVSFRFNQLAVGN